MQPQKPTNQYLFSTSPEHPAEADAPHAGNPPFHARPMLTLAFGLLLGLYLGERFSLLTAMAAVLILLIAALGAKLVKRGLWALFLLAMAAGFLRIGLAAPAQSPTGQGVVTGTICETPELRDDGTYRIYLKNAALGGAATLNVGDGGYGSVAADPDRYFAAGSVATAAYSTTLAATGANFRTGPRKLRVTAAFAAGTVATAGDLEVSIDYVVEEPQR